jgi:L-ascorbate metabolism protein UlaG (beta-lactamase superfamily)
VIGLTWLGHASTVIDLDGVRILTDPLLRSHAGLLRRVGPTPDPAVWQDPDVVLVSHLHLDHAEVASLRMLGSAPVLTGPANRPWLARRTPQLQVIDTPTGHWVRVGPEVEVRLVRADHEARPMPHRPNDAHGHLVRGGGHVVWFAGDTSLHPEMEGLADLAGGWVDVALLPIAGWGPRLSEGHMGPPEAVEACARVRPAAVLPIHYGSLHARGMGLPGVGLFGTGLGGLAWMQRPLAEFRAELAERCPEVTLLDLPPGGTTTWP